MDARSYQTVVIQYIDNKLSLKANQPCVVYVNSHDIFGVKLCICSDLIDVIV